MWSSIPNIDNGKCEAIEQWKYPRNEGPVLLTILSGFKIGYNNLEKNKQGVLMMKKNIIISQ